MGVSHVVLNGFEKRLSFSLASAGLGKPPRTIKMRPLFQPLHLDDAMSYGCMDCRFEITGLEWARGRCETENFRPVVVISRTLKPRLFLLS